MFVGAYPGSHLSQCIFIPRVETGTLNVERGHLFSESPALCMMMGCRESWERKAVQAPRGPLENLVQSDLLGHQGREKTDSM